MQKLHWPSVSVTNESQGEERSCIKEEIRLYFIEIQKLAIGVNLGR